MEIHCSLCSCYFTFLILWLDRRPQAAGEERRTHILNLSCPITSYNSESQRPPHSLLSLPKSLCVQHVSGQKNIKITCQIKIHSFLPPDRAKLTPVNHESALLILIRVKSYWRQQSFCFTLTSCDSLLFDQPLSCHKTSLWSCLEISWKKHHKDSQCQNHICDRHWSVEY